MAQVVVRIVRAAPLLDVLAQRQQLVDLVAHRLPALLALPTQASEAALAASLTDIKVSDLEHLVV